MISGRHLGAALLLAVTLGAAAGCSVGDVDIRVTRSWDPGEDPFADAKRLRVRVVDGSEVVAGPTTLMIDDREGKLERIPLGDALQVVVEGLGPLDNVVSKGRTAPLEIDGDTGEVTVFVGLDGRFSYTPKRLKRPRAFHTATRMDDGSVLLVGGVHNDWTPEQSTKLPVPLVTAERLDGDGLERVFASSSGCADARTCMSAARVGHTATRLGSSVVIAGGQAADGKAIGSAEVFEGDRFFKAAELSIARAWHGAVPAGAGVLIVGGIAGAAPAGRSVELYTKEGYKLRAGMKQGRRGFTLTLLDDGRLLAAGGVDPGGAPQTSVEAWDPRSETWSAAGEMKVPRAYHTATVLEDGKVLFAGGLTSAAGQATASLERYDVDTGTSQRMGSVALTRPRWAHTATRISGGRVLLIGGFGASVQGAPTNEVEQLQFVGQTALLEPLSSTREPRGGHTATLLGSGHVLVAGGITITGSRAVASNTAEVYIF